MILRLLRNHLPPAPSHGRRQLLDVGTGTGAMLEYLEPFGDVQAVEFEEEAVRFSHLRGATGVRLYDGNTLPFEDSSFDVVTSFDVIEHVEDDATIVAEMHRVLRPGGLLVVTVPAYPFLWGRQDEISHHYRRYVRSGLKARLTGAGFDLERVSYFNTLLFPGIAAIRLLRRGEGQTDGEEVSSDFEMTGEGLVNRMLARLFASEAALVARRDLPFGVSLIAVARRRLV